jgi:type VI secretion system protein VasG
MDVKSLKPLVERLDQTCRHTLEMAAGLCMTRTNYDIELEHFLLKLLEEPHTDMEHILHHYEVNQERLTNDVTRALERLRTGNARPPAFSSRLFVLLREAWLLASLEYDAMKIRSGHLLVALLLNDPLASIAREISKEFEFISVESLRRQLPELVAGSIEERQVGEPSRPLTQRPVPTPVITAPHGGSAVHTEE